MIDEGQLEDAALGEIKKEHLLGLVLELKKVREVEAAKKLEVSLEQVTEWADELQLEGYIEITEDEINNRGLNITPEGLKEVKKLHVRWAEEREKVEREKEKVDPKVKFLIMREKVMIFILSTLKAFRDHLKDMILILSFLFSIYLLREFLLNPNVEALSFFFGALLFSFVLILYQQYNESLKTRKFVSFLTWLELMAEARRKYIIATLIMFFLIYLIGMFILNPEYKGVYLILAVLGVSTALLIYAPKKSIREAISFYVGIILLVYCMENLIGWMSLTGTFFGSHSRVLDSAVAFGVLFFVYLNRDIFGLKISELQNIYVNI